MHGILLKQVKLIYVIILFWLSLRGIVAANENKLIILDLMSYLPFFLGLSIRKTDLKMLQLFYSIILILACVLVFLKSTDLISQDQRNLHEFRISNFTSGILLLAPILLLQSQNNKSRLKSTLFFTLNFFAVYFNFLLGNRLGSALGLSSILIYFLYNVKTNIKNIIITLSLLLFLVTYNKNFSIAFEKIYHRFTESKLTNEKYNNERFYEIELAWEELSLKEKILGKGFGGTVFVETPIYIEKNLIQPVYKAYSMYVVMVNDKGEIQGKLLLHSFFGTVLIKGGLLVFVILLLNLFFKKICNLNKEKNNFDSHFTSDNCIKALYVFACLVGLAPNYSFPLSTFFLGVLFKRITNNTENKNS